MSIWQVIGGAITLAITIMAWIKTANDSKVKQKESVDADIDKASNATDLMRLFDRLRHK